MIGDDETRAALRAAIEATLREIDDAEVRHRAGRRREAEIDRSLRGDFGHCSTTASFIARRHGGRVVGYVADIDDGRVGAGVGGHDFADVDNFIVDWWGAAYEGEAQRVYDLTSPEDALRARERYGDPSSWRDAT